MALSFYRSYACRCNNLSSSDAGKGLYLEVPVSSLPETHSRSQLLGRIRERILVYGTSRIGRESAEDLAQETLMLIETRYSHLDQIGDLVPLAIRIMNFKVKSLRRGLVRQRLSDTPVDETPIADPAPDAARQAETSELQNRIMAALEKLGGRCRRLFLLKLEGHRLPEIRELLGADTMQQLYLWDFRCRERMRELTGYSGAK